MTTSTFSVPSRPPRLRRKKRIVGCASETQMRRRRGAVAGAQPQGARRVAAVHVPGLVVGHEVGAVELPAGGAAGEVAVADERVVREVAPRAKGCSSTWPSQSARAAGAAASRKPRITVHAVSRWRRRYAWSPPSGPSFGSGTTFRGRYRDALSATLSATCPHANRFALKFPLCLPMEHACARVRWRTSTPAAPEWSGCSCVAPLRRAPADRPRAARRGGGRRQLRRRGAGDGAARCPSRRARWTRCWPPP